MRTNDSASLMSLESVSTLQENSHRSDRVMIPYMSVLSDRIVMYRQPEGILSKRLVNEKSIANLSKKQALGKLSRATVSYIRKKLDNWLNAIQVYNEFNMVKGIKRGYYPVFITLTLSDKQKHSDKEVKRHMLEQFLDKYEYHSGSKLSFWRAEAQSNGNIHFHIIGDKYIDKNKVTQMWNSIQAKEGYIDEFEKRFKHRNPPSTKVQSAESVKDFVNYVLKYCTKETKGRMIEGRQWGMSDKLRDIATCTLVIDSFIESDIMSLLDKKEVRVFNDEWFTMLFTNNKPFTKMKDISFVRDYRFYLIGLYKKLYMQEATEEKKGYKDIMIDEYKVHEKRVCQFTIFDAFPEYCPLEKPKFLNDKFEQNF